MIAWLRFGRPQRPALTVGVRLLLVHEREVALVQHTYVRQWYLPGGGVEPGESLVDAARREGREEIGAELGDLRLFGAYSNFREGRSDHVVVFTSQSSTLGEPDGNEVAELCWFPLHSPPRDTSPGTLRRLAEYREDAAGGHSGFW